MRDTVADAYEKAVDRFLDDPAFGERWARMWLDQARYADSAGYGSDPLRPTIWRYRDWVIDAFNRNLPFDRFTLEQIAGDLLPNPSLEERIATAFHRNTMTNTEGGTDDEEFRVAAIKDRVDTTMQVWMGLTMGCAKCHSHKFDPITHEEYYKFYAIFNQTADNDQPTETPVIPVPTSPILDRIRKIDDEIAQLRKSIASPGSAPSEKAVRDKIAALEKSKPAIPGVPVMVELPPKTRRVTRILRKGNFLDPGDVVGAGRARSRSSFPGRSTQEPARTGAVARRSRQPADGPGGRESLLGPDLRHGSGRDRGRLRHAGRAAQPSRAARLAGGMRTENRAGTPSRCCG